MCLVDRIIKICKEIRPFSTNEKALQSSLELILPPGFTREHHLSKTDIIDFYYKEERLGVECKVKGSESKILSQLLSYALTGQVDELLLLTTKPISNYPLSFTVDGREVPLTVHQLTWL